MRAAQPHVDEPHAVRLERFFRGRFGLTLAPDERSRQRAIDRVGRRASRHARPVVVELERSRVRVDAGPIGAQRQHRHRRHVGLVEAQLLRHVEGRQCGLRQHFGQHLVGLLAGDAHRPVPAKIRGPPETARCFERRHRVRGDDKPAAENQRRLVQSEARRVAHERAGQHVGRVRRLRVGHDLEAERPRPRIPAELVICD